jgi:hypothetical protein
MTMMRVRLAAWRALLRGVTPERHSRSAVGEWILSRDLGCL